MAATLLAVPWASPPDDEETLIRTYADTRVVPNLLYAAKVLVQRRTAVPGFVPFHRLERVIPIS